MKKPRVKRPAPTPEQLAAAEAFAAADRELREAKDRREAARLALVAVLPAGHAAGRVRVQLNVFWTYDPEVKASVVALYRAARLAGRARRREVSSVYYLAEGKARP